MGENEEVMPAIALRSNADFISFILCRLSLEIKGISITKNKIITKSEKGYIISAIRTAVLRGRFLVRRYRATMAITPDKNHFGENFITVILREYEKRSKYKNTFIKVTGKISKMYFEQLEY